MRPALIFENNYDGAIENNGFPVQADAALGVLDEVNNSNQRNGGKDKTNISALQFLGNARELHASYVKQRDVFDDGEPPQPRSGWSVQQLNLICIVKALEHLPLAQNRDSIPYFLLELNIGSQTYKTPVCIGDPAAGQVTFDQIFNTLVDDEVFDGLSASLKNGTAGPCLSATCYECSRRMKDRVVGHVVLSMSDLLEIQHEGWHTLSCHLVDSERKNVLGSDGFKATLSMAFRIDERCKIQALAHSRSTLFRFVRSEYPF